jgi:hypothetical protein
MLTTGGVEEGGGRRPTVVSVVVVIVVLLPSCRLDTFLWGKPANPPVGIAPRRFPPGSARVPSRLPPSCGPNPPYPTLSVGGIGLMKGTPRIVLMVSLEVVLRLVTSFILLRVTPGALPPSPVTPSVAVVSVLVVQGANFGVTTTKGGTSRRGRRSPESTVRRRRRAPGLAHVDEVASQFGVGVKVIVDAMFMTTTRVMWLLAAVARIDGGGGAITGIASLDPVKCSLGRPVGGAGGGPLVVPSHGGFMPDP